jgi:hypothetical protein
MEFVMRILAYSDAAVQTFKSATCGAHGPVHTDGSTPRFRHTWTYEMRSVPFKSTGDSGTTSPAAYGTAKLEKAVFYGTLGIKYHRPQ